MIVGAMAEGLGTGLQNLLQRFDSASHLKNKVGFDADLLFLRCELSRTDFYIPPHTPPLTKEGLLYPTVALMPTFLF